MSDPKKPDPIARQLARYPWSRPIEDRQETAQVLPLTRTADQELEDLREWRREAERAIAASIVTLEAMRLVSVTRGMRDALASVVLVLRLALAR